MKKESKNSKVYHQFQNEILNKIHKEELGLTLPEDYFAQSKNEILSKISQNNNPHTINWFLRPNGLLKIAASIVLVLGIVSYFQYTSNTLSTTNEPSIVTVVPVKDINQSLAQADSNQTKNNEVMMPNSIKQLEHDKKNMATDVVQNENDILVESLFVEEAEVDQYIENSILEEI
ncbi:MAG: hypothetical protein RLZZ44_1293 [Bacteroidota bacterium]|jgi:hypothetical protein